MTDASRARAIALHDRFTHETHDRRAFMRAMVKLAGSLAAAEALVGTIAASPAAAALIAPDDRRLKTANVRWTAPAGRELHGYMAIPARAHGRQPAVLVAHENRGLNDHVRDVARRVALAGFVACAPDFLSGIGGTPPDEDAARAAVAGLDPQRTVADALATVRWLKTNRYATGKVGAVGFCWGGALVDRVAVAAGTDLAAGVAYYGPAPDPAGAAKVKAAMLLHFGGLDTRVTPGGLAWGEALGQAGVEVQSHVYDGANHAFDDDTSADRYDPAAAALAWARTTAFLKEHLT